MDSSRGSALSRGLAAPIIAATLGGGVAVERVIGGAFGDRHDNPDRGLDP